MKAVIQFIQGVDELHIPRVQLTISRDVSTGTDTSNIKFLKKELQKKGK